MKILVLNGPNINMLGIREPNIYGSGTYAQLVKMIEDHCRRLGICVECRQTNSEGELVGFIQEAYGSADGIVINPAAYTHTSIAILDALKAVGLPAVEVHISDVGAREPFRGVSYIRMACAATITGRGFAGYLDALDYLTEHIGAGK